MNNTELLLKSGKTLTRIPLEAIVQVVGLGNYSQILLRDGRRVVSAYTLKVYENLLPGHFLRVHKACLVNSHCIVGRISPVELLLIDGRCVTVARRKAKAIQKQVANAQRPTSGGPG